MSTYSVSSVERLLRNYLNIRYLLDVNAQQLRDTSVSVGPNAETRREMPLGMSRTDTVAWPFRETRHARPPIDGKARARAREELHCSVIDLENVFPYLSKEDQELLTKYHVYQTHTLDDLTAERGLTSRGAMQRRILRSVGRLRNLLERAPHEAQR